VRMKAHQAGILLFFMFLSIVVAALLWGAYTSQITAFMATQSLKLRILLPTGVQFDPLRNEISLNLMAIIENKASTDIEIDGGEYIIYLSTGWHEYPLVRGEIREMHIPAYSFREVPLTARINVAKLPDIIKSVISEEGASIDVTVEMTLWVPMKFLGVKIWTNNVKLTMTQHISH